MNVKDFCNLIEEFEEVDRKPLKITIGFDADFPDVDYDRLNPFHISAYGKWKVSKVIACDMNEIHIVIATEPAKPIEE